MSGYFSSNNYSVNKEIQLGNTYINEEKEYIEMLTEKFYDENIPTIDSFFKTLYLIKDSEKGVSDTVIINAVLNEKIFKINKTKPNDVIIKISYSPRNDTYDDFDNSLEVERQIYNAVISEMLKYTPFLINIIAIFSVKKDTKLRNFIQKDTPRLDETLNLLITEKINGDTLKKFLDKLNEKLENGIIVESEIILVSLMFQLLWTLEVFYRYKFKHNDLHFGNIFVEELDLPIILSFCVDDNVNQKKYVKLKCKYIIKIFDFDKSTIVSHSKVERNIALDIYFCKNYGECNYKSSKFDLLSVTTRLLDSIKSNCIFRNKFLKQIINSNSDYLSKNHRLKYNLFPDDSILNSSIQCLNKLIDIYRNKNSSFTITEIKESVNFYLPEKIKIIYTNPINPNIFDHNLSENNLDENDRQNKEYINIQNNVIETINKLNTSDHLISLWDDEFKTNGYNWSEESTDLIYLYINKKSLEYTKGICMACLLLSSPIYYKLPKNKIDILVLDYLIDKLNIYNEENELEKENITEIIDKIWKTFNPLPIKIPNFNMDI